MTDEKDQLQFNMLSEAHWLETSHCYLSSVSLKLTQLYLHRPIGQRRDEQYNTLHSWVWSGVTHFPIFFLPSLSQLEIIFASSKN